MTDQKKTPTPAKPKSGNLGTLLLMAGTAIVTAIAMQRKKQIVNGISTAMTAGAALAQRVTEEGLEVLAPGKQNGAAHTVGAN